MPEEVTPFNDPFKLPYTPQKIGGRSLCVLRRADPARFAEARRLIKAAFRLYRGSDRCALRAIFEQAARRIDRVRAPVFVHVRTNGRYELIAHGCIEGSGQSAVIYRSVATGVIWVRPAAEFYDGRFTPLTDAAVTLMERGVPHA